MDRWQLYRRLLASALEAAGTLQLAPGTLHLTPGTLQLAPRAANAFIDGVYLRGGITNDRRRGARLRLRLRIEIAQRDGFALLTLGKRHGVRGNLSDRPA